MIREYGVWVIFVFRVKHDGLTAGRYGIWLKFHNFLEVTNSCESLEVNQASDSTPIPPLKSICDDYINTIEGHAHNPDCE